METSAYQNADVRGRNEYHRNPNWVPQKSQDYVLRSTLGERNTQYTVMLLGRLGNI